MPTLLPSHRPGSAKPVKPKQTVISLLLNIFMICSALVLTFMVLITQERYAHGPREYQPAASVEPDVNPPGILR